MKKPIAPIALFAGIFAVLASCYFPSESPGTGGDSRFSVQLAVKGISPSLSTGIESVDIAGYGPEGAVFQAPGVLRGTPMSFEVPAGPWRIEASMNDSEGRPFVFGTASVVLRPGEIRQVQVVLSGVTRFVAVNSLTEAYYSADGAQWYGPYATGLTTVNAVTYAKGIYVAAGRIGTNYGLSSSPDGITWTAQNLGGAYAALSNVAANPEGVFLAIGYSGSTGQSFRSLDGIEWEGPTTAIYPAIGPAWLDGNWYITDSNLSTWRKSSDGTAWDGTGLGSSGMYGPAALIGVGGALIVGGGAPGGTNKQAVTSFDGAVTFGALKNVAGATDYIYALAADPGTHRVLAVGNGAVAQVNYSDDYGLTWTTSSGTGSGTFRAALFYGEGFLIGDNTGTMYTSPDGAGFSPAGNCGSSEIRGIAYNGAP